MATEEVKSDCFLSTDCSDVYSSGENVSGVVVCPSQHFKSSSHRETQKQSAASRAPPSWNRGSGSGASKPKPDLRTVLKARRSENGFVTIDLKVAYFHVSILPTHRNFLRFAFGGKAYQYWVLPFGLALSPPSFSKCVDAALAPL
uniref:ribonuclease H n=1 Tax=Cyprinus carpio TaxID=7962 RepID=A0A8C1JST9_CYPCA